jgi:hypothetical protein
MAEQARPPGIADSDQKKFRGQEALFIRSTVSAVFAPEAGAGARAEPRPREI